MDNFDKLMASAPTVHSWICPEHGIAYGQDLPTAGRMAWECPACEQAAREEIAEWERQWRRYVYWDRQSNIPFRFRNRTLANWARDSSNQAIGAALDRYAANIGENVDRGAGMTLLGPPGLGKTHVLTAIVSQAIQAGRTAHYAVWPDVVTQAKNNFNLRREEERRDPTDVLRTVDLLALDELALKQGASEFEAGLLFEVLDFRYRERLCTLAASNATKATLAAAVGDRIADRLMECAPAVSMVGTSRRSGAEGVVTGPAQLEQPPEQIVTRCHGQGKWREQTHKHEQGRGGR